MVITGVHDQYLVVLSILIAIFASFTALSLASRIRASSNWMRDAWVIAAAVALGGGIWSMHFVAMLAFSMPGMTMSYDLGLTLLSLTIAVVFTFAGFSVMNWEAVSRNRVIAAGLLMGSGVLAMHYIGMAAMRMPATLQYGRLWLSISVLIAIGAATAAIWLAARDQKLTHQLLAALVMGLAIAGMHYAGMQAAIFTAAKTADMAHGRADVGQTYLATLVSVITMITLLLALSAARVEKLFQAFSRREARSVIRLKIADVFRAGGTDDALQEVAALLGKHFGASRAGFGLLDPHQDVFDYDVCWTDGTIAPLLGRHPAAAFGVKIVRALTAGETVVVEDLLEADISDEDRTQANARELDTRAILVVPFVRDGRLRTIVYLNDRKPRRWEQRDVVFLEEIAERTRFVIERAQAEEQLRELNSTLEARVQARTSELEHAQEALLQSQKMEAIGQLVSGLAHDFNNVLGAIVGAFDLINRRNGEPDRVQRYAQAGLEAAERGAKLTAQLLAFSRSQRIEFGPLIVCNVIGDLRDMLARTLGPSIRLDFQLNPAPVPVMGDATQLEMMVLNLAINARDAMPDGGTLTIKTAVIDVVGDHEVADGKYVEISVSDTGVGMDEAVLRRAMEPFFTTKAVGKGTGLGLAQIYGSARQAGGSVRIVSAPGAGTTVRVLLPCTDRMPTSAATQNVSAKTTADHKAKVLVVDDDHHVRSMLAAALSGHGHDVVEAGDAESALRSLELAVPDVAILDFAMPDVNGAVLARQITERWPRLAIIFASGFSDTQAIEAALGRGITILRKPFRAQVLLEAVDAELSRMAAE